MWLRPARRACQFAVAEPPPAGRLHDDTAAAFDSTRKGTSAMHRSRPRFVRILTAVLALTLLAIPAPAAAQESSTPPRPTDLSLSDVTHDGITLSWTAPEGVDVEGYRILRRLPDQDAIGKFEDIVEHTGSTATTWRDTGLDSETRYSYRVKTIVGGNLSKWSRYKVTTTLAQPPPPETSTPDGVVSGTIR